jgi:hypothetical protein
MEFPTLSVVRPAHQANQSAMAAEVIDRLWERKDLNEMSNFAQTSLSQRP